MEDQGIVLKQTLLIFYGPTVRSWRLVSAPSVRTHSCDAACQSANMRRMKARLLKKFEDEIHALDKELKTELPKEIKRARELGDLRENAEYQAAKERQRLVESRISMLQKRVSEISLMNLDRIPHDKVGFGSTVHLKDANGQIVVYQLVMPEDADVEHGLISTASPIGRGLLGKEEGDEVTISAPNGSRRFELVKLVTIHDE
jgi:transcription elongation factor GreA